MKTINVVAAVILKGNQVFATQRGYGEFKGQWEFPGGKIEAGEDNIAALKREIKEELDIEISVQDFIHTIEYDYPNFHLSMACYFCQIESGDLVLKEHDDAKWLTKESLYSVDWLEADKVILQDIEEQLK